MNNLPELPSDQYYEAWARFPISSPLAHLLDPVSLGAFTVVSGSLRSLDGGPAQFTMSESRDLNSVVDIVVTVEAVDDTVIGPVLIGGDVAGSADEGRATLNTIYHDAILGDLTTAEGECILATPSTTPTDDENQGVWFVTPNPNDPPNHLPSLSVPALGEGWVYAAWVLQGLARTPVAVGEFAAADSADSDGAGPEAGPNLPGADFNVPGSDFVQPMPRNLDDGSTSVLICVAPGEGHHEGVEARPHNEPFPITVLELAIPLGAAPDSAMTLTRPTTALPTGNITFTR
jgi:hypothetical protein